MTILLLYLNNKISIKTYQNPIKAKFKLKWQFLFFYSSEGSSRKLFWTTLEKTAGRMRRVRKPHEGNLE